MTSSRGNERKSVAETEMLRPRRMAIFEGAVNADGEQVSSGQDEWGREVPDPVPLSPPVEYGKVGDSLPEMVRRMVQNQVLALHADLEGFDTFEEAEDFDIEDDPLDPHTPYEAVFDPQAPAPPAPVAQSSGGAGGTPPAGAPTLDPATASKAASPHVEEKPVEPGKVVHST